MNRNANRRDVLERAVGARLAQLDDAVLQWQSAETARANLGAELDEQVQRLDDPDLARGFMGVCPVVGAGPDDYRNAWLEESGASWALVGPRFRGLDLGRPFVDVIAQSDAPRTLAELRALARSAGRRFAVFEPRHARFLVAPSRFADLDRLEEAFVERVVLAAPFPIIRSLPMPGAHGQDVTLRPARDLAFEERYRRAYARLLDDEPRQAEFAQAADHEELAAYVAGGGAFEVLVDGAAAGFVAAFRDRAFGMRGHHVGEMLLYPQARGRGLGRLVQRLLVEALPAERDDLFFGVVDARNRAAVRTALGCGRRVVGAYVWVPLTD